MENDKLSNEERLMAYLDGELTPDEATKVEAALAGNSRAAQLVEELRAMQGSLQALPRHTLGADFAGQVVRAAQERMVDDEDSDSGEVLPLETLPLSSRPADARHGRGPLVWLSLAAAAMLAAIIFFPAGDQSNVAYRQADQAAPAATAAAPANEKLADLKQDIAEERGVAEEPTEALAKQKNLGPVPMEPAPEQKADWAAGRSLPQQQNANALQKNAERSNRQLAVPQDDAAYRATDGVSRKDTREAQDKAAADEANADRNAAHEKRAPDGKPENARGRATAKQSLKPLNQSLEPRAPAAPPAARAPAKLSGGAVQAGQAGGGAGKGGGGSAAPTAGFAQPATTSTNRANVPNRPGAAAANAPGPKPQAPPTAKAPLLLRDSGAPTDSARPKANGTPERAETRALKEEKDQLDKLRQEQQRERFKKAGSDLRRATKAEQTVEVHTLTAADSQQVLVVELTVPRLTWESGEFEELLSNQAVVLTNRAQQAVLVNAAADAKAITGKLGAGKGEGKQVPGRAPAEGAVADAVLAEADADAAADTAAQDGVYLETTDVQLQAILNELKNRPESFLAVQSLSTADLQLSDAAVRKAATADRAKQFGAKTQGAKLAGAQARRRQAINLKARMQLAQEQAGQAQRVQVVESAALLKNLAENQNKALKEAKKAVEGGDQQAEQEQAAGSPKVDRKENPKVVAAQSEPQGNANAAEDLERNLEKAKRATRPQTQRVLFVFRLVEPGQTAPGQPTSAAEAGEKPQEK